MSILLLIQSSYFIYTDEVFQKKREKQIDKALRSLAHYNDFFIESKIDIVLVDNTCDKLPDTVTDLLPNNMKVISMNNNQGQVNKGVGIISVWKDLRDIINKYDWIIHFESRLCLKNVSFFERFMRNKQIYFTKEPNFHKNKMYFTGLFSIKSATLFKYIDEENVPYMLKTKNLQRSIEERLHLFVVKYSIPVIYLEVLGIIRNYMNKKGKVRALNI